VTFYLGRPANGLVALPPPSKGLAPTLERVSTVHESSAGGRVVDLAPRTRRTFSLAWSDLDPVALSTLEEFYTGARGVGPFVLLDPGRRNQLTANQSGATSATNDTTGFTIAAGAGEALASAVGVALRGPRSLRWLLPATVVSGLLELTPPAGLQCYPTPAGVPWTWSGQLLGLGQAASVTVTPALSWRRVDVSELAATLGTPTVATAAGWAPFSVSLGSPPAGAVYVRPQLRIAAGALFTTQVGTDLPLTYVQPRPAPTGAAVVVGPNRPAVLAAPAPRWSAPAIVSQPLAGTTDVYVDQMMLDMFASPRAWTIGTGVPQVSFTTLVENYATLPQRNVTATLIEVG